MNKYAKRSVLTLPLFWIISCLLFSTRGMAGEEDSYRYILESSHSAKVCRHMKDVYNRYFVRPFKVSTKDEDYEEGGRFALPMLPGVKRDRKFIFQARLSLQPTSPEFEAVKWQEGRFRHTSDQGDGEMLIANLDIDNDGAIETVIKNSFMEGYLPSHRSMFGGKDSLFVFRAGDLDISKPIQVNTFYEGQEGNQQPALIGGFGYPFPFRLVRLFTYEGTNYLSAYRQKWLKEDADPYKAPDREYMEVLQYHGGGDSLGKGNWSPLKLDTICRFRMTKIK